MRQLITVFISVLIVWSVHPSVPAAERKDFTGIWLTDKADGAVAITPCGDDLCGYIHSILSTPDPSLPLNDNHNVNPKLRGRALCGLKILSGLKRESDTTWSGGAIYDPDSGKSYAAEITLQSQTELAVRGYIGTRVVGRTVLWTRPTDNLTKCSGARVPK